MTNGSQHAAFRGAMEVCGLVAILRGITPQDAAGAGDVLYEAGFRVIEVPLNSPEPMRSIGILRERLPADAVIGAGTVIDVADVARVAAVGGQLIVMPHSDPSVIRAACAQGLAAAPGVATPTEAFAALAAGAAVLKMFPAELLGPAVVKAWRAVLPSSVPLVPVGGITPENMAAYVAAGAQGFGLGSALYRPGDAIDAIGAAARRFVTAWTTIHSGDKF